VNVTCKLNRRWRASRCRTYGSRWRTRIALSVGTRRLPGAGIAKLWLSAGLILSSNLVSAQPGTGPSNAAVQAELRDVRDRYQEGVLKAPDDQRRPDLTEERSLSYPADTRSDRRANPVDRSPR